MGHLRESLQIFYPTHNPHIWRATTENHYQASGMHRDHYFSNTPLPESTHLDCYYSESLPSCRNAPRSLLLRHLRLKIGGPTRNDMKSPLLRHPPTRISTNRGHRRKIGTSKIGRRESLQFARSLHEISTKRNLLRKSLQFPTRASQNRMQPNLAIAPTHEITTFPGHRHQITTFSGHLTSNHYFLRAPGSDFQ